VPFAALRGNSFGGRTIGQTSAARESIGPPSIRFGCHRFEAPSEFARRRRPESILKFR